MQPSERFSKTLITFFEFRFVFTVLSMVIFQRTNSVLISRYVPERNANRFQPAQDIELCNCMYPIYPNKTATLTRSFVSLPKLENVNLSQVSLDRKNSKYRPKHSHACDQSHRVFRDLEKGASLKRMQSPEIINIHRGPMYEGHESDTSVMKEFKCKKHELRRGRSVRIAGSR